jgi:hypothetical protein
MAALELASQFDSVHRASFGWLGVPKGQSRMPAANMTPVCAGRSKLPETSRGCLLASALDFGGISRTPDKTIDLV